MLKTWEYLKGRAMERSTWLSVGHAIVAASVYPSPYQWVALALSIVQMAMPEAEKA